MAVHTADLPTEPTHHLTQQLSQKTFPKRIKDGVSLEGRKDLAKHCWCALSDQTYKRRPRTVAPWCPGLHLTNLSSPLLLSILLKRTKFAALPHPRTGLRAAKHFTQQLTLSPNVCAALRLKTIVCDERHDRTNQARRQGTARALYRAPSCRQSPRGADTFVERGTAFHHRPARIPASSNRTAAATASAHARVGVADVDLLAIAISHSLRLHRITAPRLLRRRDANTSHRRPIATNKPTR